jgi:signal transduction histidine kinase
MQDLEISASAVSITLLNKGSKDTESYVCGLVDGEMDLRHYRLLYSDNSISNDLFNAQNSGLDFFTKTYGLEEKNIFYDYQFEFSGLKNAPDSVKQYVYQSKSYTISMAIAKHSMIVINDFEGKTPSENEVDIIKRFAKVFEQAYIRFLDVQKAEAQAKEGQIQLALERVRARTMAMQHSDELSETAYILFQQFNQLGENPDQATIGIVNEDEWVIEYWVTMYGDQTSKTFKFSIDEPNVTNRIYRAWKAGEKSRVIDLQGDELRDFSIYRAGMGGAAYNKDEQRRVVNVAFFAKGLINVQSAESRSAESILLLERFATVFEGTYQRFLDLKQAEAQAKEGQIQLALERVRARTMAMQHSEELSETAYLLSEQFRQFGEATIQITIGIIDEEHRVIEFAGTDTGGNKSVGRIKASIDQSGLMNKLYTAWKQKKKSAIVELRDDELVSWVNYRNSLMGRNEGLDQLDGARYVNSAFFSKGVMSLSALEPRSPEVIRLLERFAEVFDGTYTRFLDLKQAEAQAREAQIQLGLERVRARAMAMQTSNELADLVSTVLNELKKLDFALSWCLITIIDYDAWCCRVWMANPNVNQLPQSYLLQFADYPFQKAIMQAWKERQSKWVYELKGDEKKAIDEYMFTKTEYSKLPKVAQDNVRSLDPAYFSFSFSNFGGLQTGGAQPLSEDNLDILSRFGKVFDLTYTRFNDLQKAEAQAREALVEAALERVRSKTMAMHNSNDVAETAVAMVGELKKLGIDTIRCGIGIMHEPGDMEVWTVKTNENDEADMIIGWLDMHMHPLLEGAFISWRNNTEAYSYELKDEDLFNYFDAINKCPGYPIRYDTATLPKLIHHNEFHFSEGTLFSFSLQQISDEQKIIFKRFAGVFGLTYRRFLDLQKAESQAREAQIETGLERVRSRTLAMQSSEELAETAAVVFRQLINLGIEPNRLFIGIIKNESSDIELWATDEDGSKVSTRFTGNANGNKSVKEMYDGWKEGKSSITIDMQGKVLQDYFHYLTDTLHVPFKFGLDQKRRIQSVAYFSQGFIGMASPDVQPQSTIDLLERFAGVFNLTYTRFNDLQKAEAQAREAKIETALERVRARALAMQQPEELKEVAQVLRHEMGLLGIEELETCSIYMHADNSEDAECWYAIKDDKEAERKLVSDHFALNLTDTWVGMEMLKFYNSAIKQVSIAMKGANRKEWIHYCEDRSLVLRDYYGAQIPDRTYHLYKFSNGAIGAATPDNISGESWSLLKRVASVFSLAYSRFKDLTQARIDLKQLKEEKRRAEDALTELKAAQTKLIQTEKMASLGELTAGIAHEIQNPLNFVNNFSEVSIELLQELKEEAEAGNTEDVMAIAYDLTQNLGKINHHGKRADSIVKGMLEHSRVGTGEKQLTNINVMADEFLKLSYHGLRAKDKSFNAELTMKFDEQLPKINIAQQDIGRVLLNLFNNAFYAVNQKQKTEAADYKPEVSVSTSIEKSNLVIKVKDNGKGIPDAIKDKIMQPFFTTKPTGEGTGLGLSLSYDIVVKGHGGSISVDTKEGEGSEFIITLPL